MGETESGPVPQADGAEPEPDLLRGHTLALITTDEKGCINIKVDIPADARVLLVGNILAYTWLVGKLMKFLTSMQESASATLLEKQERQKS